MIVRDCLARDREPRIQEKVYFLFFLVQITLSWQNFIRLIISVDIIVDVIRKILILSQIVGMIDELFKKIAEVKVRIIFILFVLERARGRVLLLFDEGLIDDIHEIRRFIVSLIDRDVHVEHNLRKHVLYRVATVEEVVRLLRKLRIVRVVLLEQLFLIELMSSLEIFDHLFKLKQLVFKIYIFASFHVVIRGRAMETLILISVWRLLLLLTAPRSSHSEL